jgi:hypothetical protein
VQRRDLSFGHAQVEQFICDRPETSAIINGNPALRALLESCFAGDLSGQRVYWDCREPLLGREAGHFALYEQYPALVRVSSRSHSSAIDMCMYLVIELQHSRFDNNRASLDSLALQKQISRNDYARSNVRLEFESAKKAQEFFRKTPLTGANVKTDPYYIEVMEGFGDSSGWLQRQQEHPDSKNNLFQYYLHVYDRLGVEGK